MKLSLVFFLLLSAALVFGQQSQQGSQKQQQGQQGPYVFQEQHFAERFQTEHGKLRELPRFSRRSELLRGIDDFRFAVLEADPNTFVVPNHLDAELIVFVGEGNGAVSFVSEDGTATFDIRRGDIFRVPAGTTHYFINKDNNRKLVLVKLIQSVANPGEFEPFFGAGGENPQSFYLAFSNEILNAALQARNPEEVRRVFRQRQGIVVRASRQQLQELDEHRHSLPWPFRRGGESQSQEKVNIFEKQPAEENQFGKLYEVSSNDFRQLREIDVAISYANITRGGMTAPVYNSKAWKLAFVLSPRGGYFEAACPHLNRQQQQAAQGQQEQGQGQCGQGSQEQGSRQQQEQGQGSQEQGSRQQQEQGQGSQGSRQQEQGQGSQEQGSRQQGSRQQGQQGQEPVYQRVSGPLRQATLVVVPPGHPAVFVASNNDNLEVVCFEINANGNQKVALAGRDNVYNQLPRVAKDLSFGSPAREVEELFGRNKLKFFLRGPQQQPRQQQGGGREEGDLRMVV